MVFAATKTWSDGTVLYSADINGNFEDIEDEINGVTDTGTCAIVGGVRVATYTDGTVRWNTQPDNTLTPALKAIYTVTPEGTNNVIIGVLWRALLYHKTAEECTAYLQVDAEAMPGSTSTNWKSNIFKIGGADSAGYVQTDWQWSHCGFSRPATWTDYYTGQSNGSSEIHAVFAGQTGYGFKLYLSGDNDLGTNDKEGISTVELKIYYLDKGLTKTGIITCTY